MTFAALFLVALMAGLLLLAYGGINLSAGATVAGLALIALAIGGYFFRSDLVNLNFQELISTTHATSTKRLSAVCKEAEQMVHKGRSIPAKMPTIISVE